MTTFSQLVDKMVLESKRPDLLSEIVSYLTLTIREVHFEPDKSNVVFYRSNYREALITAANEFGYYWTIPDPAIWQGVQAVQFRGVVRDGRPVFADEVVPGRFAGQKPFTYMVTGDRIIFGGDLGYGGLNAPIGIAYYEYPKSLKYFPVATRPASYDPVDGWTYADGIVTDEEKLAAREKVTNWLLLRWDMVIEEGVRASVYKRSADEVRQRTSYSKYRQLQRGLFTSEVAVLP